ncbi:VanZ like family protein [Pseudoalteromonas sp. NC201]|jgi:VanZ family protein|nr:MULTISPECIES: VanZ family protein [unclassified Pseudoalteromonas]AUJ71366.1 VanZ like family protein [Pseudoalteromonas sp. NC201]
MVYCSLSHTEVGCIVTRRVYKALLIISLIICTVLFAKEISLSPKLFPNIDKVAHFGVFFVLAFISHHAFKVKVWTHIVLLSLYGAGIEWMQHSLPYRQASTADFFADLAGAVSYFVLFYIWASWRNRKHG